MQIKTGLVLAAGIGAGVLAGMCVGEDKKSQIIQKIKGRIIYLLTGEEWKPKKAPPPHVSYKDIARESIKRKAELLNNREWQDMLYFENTSDANAMREKIINMVKIYGTVSVLDLGVLVDKKRMMDYTWNRIGWTKKEIELSSIVDTEDGYWKLKMPDPVYL